MASMVGGDVPFRCVGTDGLMWSKHVGGGNPWLNIVNMATVGNKTKYAIKTEPENNYELTIKSVILNDARRYQCGNVFDNTVFGNAELIVFGKKFFQFYQNSFRFLSSTLSCPL